MGVDQRFTVSDTHTKRIIPPKHKRSTQSKLMVAFSLFVSVLIIVWTFSIPFHLVASARQNDLENVQLAKQIEQKRTQNQRIREDAFAAHQEFLQKIANQRGWVPSKPGSLEVRKHWEKKIAKVQKQLLELGDPEPGTNEWDRKQRLLESISDAPL